MESDFLRPDINKLLAPLKDFQRTTVEYAFRRLYLDADHTRRFLVADEVGLGKTLVARGVIAKTIDYLWDRSPRIDVLYVCSNADIARQNIKRLNVTDSHDVALPSRITLLPLSHGHMERQRLNFVSFTPATSFELTRSSGWSVERQLLYWLLERCGSFSHAAATRVLQGNSDIANFRTAVNSFHSQCKKLNMEINEKIAAQFKKDVTACDLWERFRDLCETIPKAGASIPDTIKKARHQLVGQLRRCLALTCLNWLQPDLIILDEFQKFKDLLKGDTEDASEAAQLAKQLFDYQEPQADSALAARVLLLSATPYRMYTMSHETATDDHYKEFHDTLRFLLNDDEKRGKCHGLLQSFREELFHVADRGPEKLQSVKTDLEQALRGVMVRTERLALTSDRNGMLTERTPDGVQLTSSDIWHYLSLQEVTRTLGLDDILEYWKSAPYLLNFMEDYELKRKVHDSLDSDAQPKDLVRALKRAGSALLDRERLEQYGRLDPANVRLRSLHKELIDTGTWRLLWVPPSLPYYEAGGAFADPAVQGFTKRLVFSCWKVVPKAIASVLSYEAERSMMQSFRKRSVNTAEAREKRRGLLRFSFGKGRATGLPVLGLVYPCRTLAEQIDPLSMALGKNGARLPSLDQVIGEAEAKVGELLSPILQRLANEGGPADESWYWAAPLLLDLEHDNQTVRAWFEQDELAELWSGGTHDQREAGTDWSKHVGLAREVIDGERTFGPPPADLAKTLALMTLAGPGVASFRALRRLGTNDNESNNNENAGALRNAAGLLAHGFIRLFNLPEVTALVRDRKREMPYWRSVLEYCLSGNLQAVMDEFCHLLVESLGLMGRETTTIWKEVADTAQNCLTFRTSTAKADIIKPGKRRAELEPQGYRFRTRFAIRFGDQEPADGGETARAEVVRTAFNSPFWPFVLATTSVGQEGLDFHHYCHCVVHWNLPSNPVDLEQREGRVHRYKGHALRKNIAGRFATELTINHQDPWAGLFQIARSSRPPGENDLFPYWVMPDGIAKIERVVPALPHSKELVHQARLRYSLVVYRMVFGQNRQQDLVQYLTTRLKPDQIAQMVELCRVNLTPPSEDGPDVSVFEGESTK